MKLELTTGVALSVGLVILFGAGYGAVDKVIESGATRQLEETVAAESRAIALGGVLRWERLLDRYRGVTKAGLQNPIVSSAQWAQSDGHAQALENVLATLLDRTNGRGQAAVLNTDGEVVSSTVAIKGLAALNFGDFQAVKDASNGAAIVRAEMQDDKMYVVASSPIDSADAIVGVLVVTAPVDNRQISAWALEPPVLPEDSVLVLSGRTGDRVADNFRGAATQIGSRISQPGLVSLDETEYWASREVLVDDSGLIGHVVGLSIISREPVHDLVGKVRRMVLLLGAVALLMTLMVSMFTPGAEPVVKTISVPAPAPVAKQEPIHTSPLAGGVPDVVPQPSVSDDLPPLRLGQDSNSSSTNEASSPPSLGLAAQLAAAATQDTKSSPPTPRAEASSPASSDVPTPENVGDVTRGKGASPRPEAIESLMNRPKSRPSLSPPPAPKTPPPPKPPPAPVSAEPGPFGVGSIEDGQEAPKEEAENIQASTPVSDDVPPSFGATDLPPPPAMNEWGENSSNEAPFGTAPFSASIGNDASDESDLGFTPGFGEGNNGFSMSGSEPPPAFEGEASDSSDDMGLPSSPPPAASLDSLPPPPAAHVFGSSNESSDASPDPLSFTDAFATPSVDENEATGSAEIFGENSSGVAADPAESSPSVDEGNPFPPSPFGSLPPPPLGAVSDGAATLMTQGAPIPPLPATETESTTQMTGVVDESEAYSEGHYRSVYESFVGSKRNLGENVDSIMFEGFSAKLRKSEQKLIEQHGCKAVRFEVLVKGDKVSLRPQLVR